MAKNEVYPANRTGHTEKFRLDRGNDAPGIELPSVYVNPKASPNSPKPTLGEVIEDFEDESYGSVGAAICPTSVFVSDELENQ